MDPCVAFVEGTRNRPRWTPLQKLVALPLRRAALHSDTPHERIERAVKRELSDLSERADRALGSLARGDGAARAAEAREALRRGSADGSFPRDQLQAIVESSGPGRLREELGVWIDKHKRLERRLQWLLDPESTREALATLDPVEDADRLCCFVSYDFRLEILFCGWGNGIERISQSEAVATFFHATGTAEGRPLKRTEDTLVHYHYFFNWGLDSYHGRKAVESMNRIHGDYFIHNDGMKFVLLNSAFTVLDAIQAIGHRPLSDRERLGYFHAQVEMGRAMRIQELTHSWDEMRGWFDGLNRALAPFAPMKRRMWSALEDNFDRAARVPGPVSWWRQLLEVAAMDDSYRSALGFTPPSARKVAFARSVVNAVVRVRRLLPREPYVASLQNFVSYPNGVNIEDAGEKARSARLPQACPFSAKALRELSTNHSVSLPPLMQASDAPEMDLRVIGWDEVRRHTTEGDLWVVFGGHVYDVSSFAKNHPGGLPILLKGAGRDMTRAFENAKHSDLTKVFALNFRIGTIESARPAPAAHPELRADS